MCIRVSSWTCAIDHSSQPLSCTSVASCDCLSGAGRSPSPRRCTPRQCPSIGWYFVYQWYERYPTTCRSRVASNPHLGPSLPQRAQERQQQRQGDQREWPLLWRLRQAGTTKSRYCTLISIAGTRGHNLRMVALSHTLGAIHHGCKQERHTDQAITSSRSAIINKKYQEQEALSRVSVGCLSVWCCSWFLRSSCCCCLVAWLHRYLSRRCLSREHHLLV